MLQDIILTYSEEAELRGMEKGIEKGMEKGMEKGREEMARNLLANGISPEIIAKSAGLSLERIQAMEKQNPY